MSGWDINMNGARHDRSSPPQALRQKRRHTKSKKGCVTCKLRRVKCDESLPRCRVCSTRGLRCEYAATRGLEILDTPSLSSTRSPSPLNRATPTTNNMNPSETSTPDALLWQYYLAHASKTITASSTDPAHTRMWAESIPAIAFSSAVVSHALMAFSAFCLCASPSSISRKTELRVTAERHYYRSVKLLRSSLTAAGEREADVVLACAMVLIPCSLALVGCDDRESFCVQDWACHLRGWRMIGKSIYGEVGAAAKLIPYPQPGIPDADDLPERVLGGGDVWTLSMPLMKDIQGSWMGAVASLKSAVDAHCWYGGGGGGGGDAADATVYTSAITALEHVVDYILAYPVVNLFRAVFIWPIWVSSDFIQLLAQHDDLALAIYSHWLVLTMTLGDLWWLEGFGSGQIERLSGRAARSNVSGFNEPWGWPVEMLRARCVARKDQGRLDG